MSGSSVPMRPKEVSAPKSHHFDMALNFGSEWMTPPTEGRHNLSEQNRPQVIESSPRLVHAGYVLRTQHRVSQDLAFN
jgi:hypothetical protein